jgi:MoaA/NifB/PqqE/SkfB family radical SAM enzyme
MAESPPPLESWNITPTCRLNRGNDGAWDEAVAALRAVYDAQLFRFGPTATLTLSIRRQRAEGITQSAYNAMHGVSLR